MKFLCKFILILTLQIIFCQFVFAQLPTSNSDTLTSDAISDETIPTQQNVTSKNKPIIKGEPIIVFGDTIIDLKTHIGSFTPEERAKSIAARIEKLNDDYNYTSDKLKVLDEGNNYAVVYNDMIIISINPEEAEAHNTSKKELAFEVKQKIVMAIAKHKENTSLMSILKRIGLVFLVIAVTFLVLQLINKVFKNIGDRITSYQGNKIKGVSFKSYKFLNAEQEVKIIFLFLKIAKYLSSILLLYLALSALFAIFPATQSIARTLLNYILNPLSKMFHNIVDYLPNLITIIVIVAVFYYIIKGLKYFAKEIKNEKIVIKGFYSDWAIPTFNIIRTLLIIFMAIIIFPYLPGSDSRIFQGISIFVGVVISLGSTNLIGNIVAGLVLTYMRPFQIGDRIKIGEVVGNVIEKTPFVVRIRSPKSEEITIPNSNILSTHTLNYTSSANNTRVAVYTSVTISYSVAWRQVHRLLLDAAMKTPLILQTPKPFVLQLALNDYYVEYQLNAYILEVDSMNKIYSDLHQNIQDIFNESGIEVMSPQYLVNRNNNNTTIPENPYKD